MEEDKTTESIKIVQHTKYGLIDIIENKDCLEVRQLSQYGGRDIVLILPENRKSIALAICPELTQQQEIHDEFRKTAVKSGMLYLSLNWDEPLPIDEALLKKHKEDQSAIKELEKKCGKLVELNSTMINQQFEYEKKIAELKKQNVALARDNKTLHLELRNIDDINSRLSKYLSLTLDGIDPEEAKKSCRL